MVVVITIVIGLFVVANRANDERTILRLSIVCSALVLLILIICLLLLSFLLGGQVMFFAPR